MSQALHAKNQIDETPQALTPMMKQYFEIKSQYPDAILFYRLGDFYEMFYDDAIEASRLLDLTLTNRNKNSADPVPLCGVPYHAADAYLQKLIKCGKKVVICEQVEDPKNAKGLVKRDVVRVMSPGTVIEEQSLSARRNNFLMGVYEQDQEYALCLCDVSTGDVHYFKVKTEENIFDELAKVPVAEVFFCQSQSDQSWIKRIKARFQEIYVRVMPDVTRDVDFASHEICQFYQINDVENLELGGSSEDKDHTKFVSVLGMLIALLKENKLLIRGVIKQPLKRHENNFMVLDESSVRNLEIFKTVNDNREHGTLFWHLDQCTTPMGSRLLAEWLRAPLMCKQSLQKRYMAVEELTQNSDLSDNIKSCLNSVSDLERLAGRFLLKSANARDAVVLAQSLNQIPQIKSVLEKSLSSIFHDIQNSLQCFESLAQKITQTLVLEPPLSLKDGGLIAEGFSGELDELRALERDGKTVIATLEAQGKEKSGIQSLKIRYNNVFGYYIEITNTHKDKVPAHYVRKQTLANAERYITDELKQWEQKVLGAGERIRQLEYDIFNQLRDEINLQALAIREEARKIATLDVLHSFSVLAVQHRYTKPELTDKVELQILEGRHPIIEKLFPSDNFIPNDIVLNSHDCLQMIITGPNMAGKSTLMRVSALIVIMAQVGSFVPAQKAKVGLVDRIFTRVGANDHLQKGYSTFMVEMIETARILREATAKSLVLLDEIGRGTSTFDGLSIAWSVAEDLHDRIRARTLFATHYHELCDIVHEKPLVKNYHVAVREWNGQVIFLRKLVAGPTNRSYGVAVAGMAGLPNHVVKRAKEVLAILEQKDLSFKDDVSQKKSNQIDMFAPADCRHVDLIAELQNIDINNMTPLQALQQLQKLIAENS